MKVSVQKRICNLLKNSGKTLSVAESCTGGQISHLITTVPGSSNYYLGSVTSYAAEVKIKVLGVKEESIRDYGLVSSQVAAEMSEGVRKTTGSTYSVATTGLAGPGGDDWGNPEGTVWIGVSTPEKTVTFCRHFKGSRTENIRHFANAALKILADEIEK